MKKERILSSSPVKEGNSVLLCREFARGAEAVFSQVERLDFTGKKYLP